MAELETGSEPPVTVEVRIEDGSTASVIITGELDAGNLHAVDAAVAPVLRSASSRLIVDVGGVRFADSSALALWVRWAASVDVFELRNPNPLLRKVINLMGLAEMMGLDR